MHLKELQRRAWQHAEDKGFHAQQPTVGDLCSLIHTEVSEGYEEWRNNKPMHYYGENGKPEGLGPELADAVIRVADMCGQLGLDLHTLVLEKMQYNSTRPHLHGGKRT